LPDDIEEVEKAKVVYSQICNDALRFNGTFSAEHGVGKTKRDYLRSMYGEVFVNYMKKLKLALDPNLIIGPGNLFEVG
jgi:D-lactate dehydrogenase (cytochrome)